MNSLSQMALRFSQLELLRKGGDDALASARIAVSAGLSSPDEERQSNSIASLLDGLSTFEFVRLPPPIRTVGAIARYPTRNYLFAALLLRVTDPLVNQQTIELFSPSAQEFPLVSDIKVAFGSSHFDQIMSLFGPNSSCPLYEIHQVGGQDAVQPTMGLKEECSSSFSPIVLLRTECLNGIMEIYENANLQPPHWFGIEKMTRYLKHFHYSYWRAVSCLTSERESELKEDLYGSIRRLLQEEQVFTLTSLFSEDYVQAFQLVRQKSRTPVAQDYRHLSYVFSVEIAPCISVNLSEFSPSRKSPLSNLPLPEKIEETFTQIVERLVSSEQARGKCYSLREEEAFFEQEIQRLY